MCLFEYVSFAPLNIYKPGMICKQLIFTSLCMPGLFVLFAYKYNIYNLYFATITTIGSIISVLFWADPINNKNKLIHKIDAITARFVIINYTLYKLFVNRNNILLFFCNYIPMLYYFYLSNKISSRNWCSISHINNHINAHIYCILCCYITFFDKDLLFS
jgi:hypothetical protein